MGAKRTVASITRVLESVRVGGIGTALGVESRASAAAGDPASWQPPSARHKRIGEPHQTTAVPSRARFIVDPSLLLLYP
jgi:hypothetical protein